MFFLVIGLSSNSRRETVIVMIKAGAKGYLSKSAEISDIIKAIIAVARHENYFASSIIGNLLRDMDFKEYSLKNIIPSLTEKELAVINHLCKQRSNKEIADELNISLRSVESAKEKIQTKTGSKNIIGIVLYAIKAGLYIID